MSQDMSEQNLKSTIVRRNKDKRDNFSGFSHWREMN